MTQPLWLHAVSLIVGCPRIHRDHGRTDLDGTIPTGQFRQMAIQTNFFLATRVLRHTASQLHKSFNIFYLKSFFPSFHHVLSKYHCFSLVNSHRSCIPLSSLNSVESQSFQTFLPLLQSRQYHTKSHAICCNALCHHAHISQCNTSLLKVQETNSYLETWRQVIFKQPKLDGRVGVLHNAEHHNSAIKPDNSQDYVRMSWVALYEGKATWLAGTWRSLWAGGSIDNSWLVNSSWCHVWNRTQSNRLRDNGLTIASHKQYVKIHLMWTHRTKCLKQA